MIIQHRLIITSFNFSVTNTWLIFTYYIQHALYFPYWESIQPYCIYLQILAYEKFKNL